MDVKEIFVTFDGDIDDLLNLIRIQMNMEFIISNYIYHNKNMYYGFIDDIRIEVCYNAFDKEDIYPEDDFDLSLYSFMIPVSYYLISRENEPELQMQAYQIMLEVIRGLAAAGVSGIVMSNLCVKILDF